MKPLNFLAKGVLPLITAVVSKLDDEAWRFLKPHENKIVCFEIVDIIVLHFIIKQDGLEIIEVSPDEVVNTTFKGTLAPFIAMVFSKKSGASRFAYQRRS